MAEEPELGELLRDCDEDVAKQLLDWPRSEGYRIVRGRVGLKTP